MSRLPRAVLFATSSKSDAAIRSFECAEPIARTLRRYTTKATSSTDKWLFLFPQLHRRAACRATTRSKASHTPVEHLAPAAFAAADHHDANAKKWERRHSGGIAH